ncbi:MAG: hypothetical protein MHM6MM_003446, partial [Cercozoa sp. M6MM]
MNRLSSEASDLSLQCVPPAAQVLRVASTSTAMDMMLQKRHFKLGSESLCRLRESRPAADADLLRLLVNLPPIDDVTLPAVFRAREAPLFE